MTLYIAQQAPNGRTQVWEADDEVHAIELMQSEHGETFGTAQDAVAHNKQQWRIRTCPASLLDGAGWPGLHDAVQSRWSEMPDDVVDLGDADEWGEGTPGAARLARFQADELASLDGAEIGQVGDYDVIYLPRVFRCARVSNGDAEWFDCTSFAEASLFAIGNWEDTQ